MKEIQFHILSRILILIAQKVGVEQKDIQDFVLKSTEKIEKEKSQNGNF